MICDICGEEITGGWFKHQRLGITFHSYHDLTNIMNEDVSQHTMIWGTKNNFWFRATANETESLFPVVEGKVNG